MPLLAINHHYFREQAPKQGIYPVSSQRMRENIAVLQNHGWEFGTEHDILLYCEGGFTGKKCIITFDDGLKEQMLCLKLLDTLGISALFFVSTEPHVSQRVLDVHKIHMIRTQLSDEDVESRFNQLFGFSGHEFDPSILALQYPWDVEKTRKVKYFFSFVLDAEQREKWVTATFKELYTDEATVAAELYMDGDDWKYLAKRNLLGTHGHRHLPLATLNAEEIRMDIQTSINTIAEVTGSPVCGIAYPFGGKSAVSDTVFTIANECGMKYGLTMQHAINEDTSKCLQPMALERIDVNDILKHI